jgi:hypothetical protein
VSIFGKNFSLSNEKHWMFNKCFVIKAFEKNNHEIFRKFIIKKELRVTKTSFPIYTFFEGEWW